MGVKETAGRMMASSHGAASGLLRGCLLWALFLAGFAPPSWSQTPEPPKPAATAYLYIEPYQTRLEALFDAGVFFNWLDEKTDLGAPLSPEAQKAIAAKVAPKVESWGSLRDNGAAAKGRLVSVSFVKGRPGQTEPMKEGESIVPKDCMVGLMWEFGTSPSPLTIEAQWWHWSPPLSSPWPLAWHG